MNKFLSIITAATLLFTSLSANAQIDLQNSGTLYITGSSDILFINGNYINTSAAALSNNGNLYVKKDITNDQASMPAGTGNLFLNGTTAQTIGGSQVFKTFNLTTSNTLGFTLNNNLSISGAHSFAGGLIASSATPNYLIYEAGSSYTGATDATHVTGWVRKNGTTNFSFPVGDATYLRSAAIVNLSAPSIFNCHYYTPTANVFNLTSPLVQVNSREYWQIDEVSGANAQIQLNWDNSKVAFDNVLISEIRVGVYNAGSWRNAGGSASGNINTTGIVTSNIGNAFAGPMTFGYASDFVLPLKIISFTAERISNSTYLHWTIADEKDIDQYEIQRSYDGSFFTKIENVAGRNSGQQENYSKEDSAPLQGITYYRIKAIDMAGKFIYTKIVAVSEKGFAGNSFTVINPARNVITMFNKSGLSGLFNFRLTNSAGQLILKGNVDIANNGIGIISVPSQSAAGMYILEIENNRIRFKQKIIIQK